MMCSMIVCFKIVWFGNGVMFFRHGDAAHVALTTCRAHGHGLDEIRFVLFGEAMYNVWAGVADDLFG